MDGINYFYIKRELDRVERYNRAVNDEIQKQTKAGCLDSANLSRKAYKHGCKYAKQLEAILDGYEHRGKALFTKDEKKRYKPLPKE